MVCDTGLEGLPNHPASASSLVSSDSGSGWPTQPQSTVRSLGSSWQLTPWSKPHSEPDRSSTRWDPLRSALLITTSNTAVAASSGRSAWATTTAVPSVSCASNTGSQPGSRSDGATTSTRPSPAPAVGDIVGAYKSLTALECLEIFKQQYPGKRMGKLWQRNYFERIIRDDQAYHNISNYIINNPANWNGDKFYLK